MVVVAAAPSVMVAAAASVMVAAASSVMMAAAASMMMAAASVIVGAASVIVGAAMIVSAAVIVAAVVAGVSPAVPPVASAPAQARAIGIPAPIPAGALPAVVVPAVVAAVEDELSLLERQELTGQGQDECAVRQPRLGRANERRCGAQRQRQTKSKFSRHGRDSLSLPNAGRRLGYWDAGEVALNEP
jgi:hypothetical protein